MRLPKVDRPQDYAGLFVYDFGDHVSIGYTGEEISFLRTQPQYARGRAYRICRIDHAGRFELLGMGGERLDGREGLIFASSELSRARTDYEVLRQRAQADPLACRTELRLARVTGADRPFAVVLAYPAYASAAIADWLFRAAFDGGDTASGGINALARLEGAESATLDRCELPLSARFVTRPPNEVLAAVDRPVQR
ncbi:MAG: hypothetical protein ACYSUQ_00735 [Planctomycetota bacterium]|jgi:hypothetical protein